MITNPLWKITAFNYSLKAQQEWPWYSENHESDQWPYLYNKILTKPSGPDLTYSIPREESSANSTVWQQNFPSLPWDNLRQNDVITCLVERTVSVHPSTSLHLLETELCMMVPYFHNERVNYTCVTAQWPCRECWDTAVGLLAKSCTKYVS